jgi:hypothetical protein
MRWPVIRRYVPNLRWFIFSGHSIAIGASSSSSRWQARQPDARSVLQFAEITKMKKCWILSILRPANEPIRNMKSREFREWNSVSFQFSQLDLSEPADEIELSPTCAYSRKA